MSDQPPAQTGAILVSERIADRHVRELSRVAPMRDLVVLGQDGLRGPADQIEIAFFSGDCFPDQTADFLRAAIRCDRLAWLHSFSAGVDDPVFRKLVDRGVRVSHSSGANAVAVAHCAISGLMAGALKLPQRLEDQRAHQWRRRISDDLEGTTLAVLGLGPIGLEVGRIAEALRMRVIGLRRKALGNEPFPTWDFDRLHELLQIADYVVLALPLTPETHHLIDEVCLMHMKSDAVIINVGRGELIEEPALIEALTNGNLRGAVLDVFETEPLPDSNPLWDLSNVIVTPHCGGHTRASHEHAVEHFFANLARYESGKPLRNELHARSADPR